MKRIYMILVLILFIQSESSSQGWEKVYKDIYSHDNSYWSAGIQKSQITSDGGTILIGYSHANNINQINLIKTTRLGTIIWSKTFKGSSEMIPHSVIETDDGFLIGGITYTPTVSFLLKVNPNGNLLWTKKYDGAESIEMIQKNTNGFILLGGKVGGNGIYCAKINNNGIIIWTKTLGTPELNAKGIAPAENNGFMVVGNKFSTVYGRGTECYIMKFDSTGAMLWAKSYGYTNSFITNTIKLTNTGDYILGGAVLMQISKDGNILWVKQWYGATIRDINQTDDNGYVIAAGGSWNTDGIFLYKVSSDGTPEWEKNFGGIHDGVTNVIIADDHGYLITGYHINYEQNFQGLYLIKTDSLGQSGCNTKAVPLMSYHLYPSLCVINNITFLPSSNPLYSNPVVTPNSVSVNVIDPCCFAKAEINSNYPCLGDSIHYSGSGAPNLQWYNGGTSNTIVTMDTIVYLTATNSCGSFTDTMVVHPRFVPSFTFTINKDTICRDDSVLLNINGNAPYYSCHGDQVNSINPTTYILKPTGTSAYTINAYTGYYGPGCNTQQTFTVYVRPDKPTVTKIADTLFSSTINNNQWLLNGVIINGATNQSLIINQSGNYSVALIGSGCSNISNAFSYTPDTIINFRNAWQKMIGPVGSGTGAGTCIVQANDGGLIIGSNYYSSLTKDDISLIKTDTYGEVIWSKSYGGTGTDNIYSIIKISSGYIAVGSTTSFGNGNSDLYILSFNEQGQLLWSKTYGDWNNQEGNSIEQTSDGGFIITGKSTNPNSYSVDQGGWLIDENDLYLVKIDINGNLLWSKVYNASNNERGLEVHETSDGNFIVSGTSGYKIFVLKTNAIGNVLWSKLISNSFYPWVASMKITSDNNYLICTNASSGAYLLKLDDNGNVLWAKLAHVNSQGTALVTTNDNELVFTTGFGYGNNGGGLTKIDLNGNLIWSTNYNSSPQQYISTIQQLSDGSFVLVGGIDTSGNYGPGQICIVNTDTVGQTNCSQSFYPNITNATYTYNPHITNVSSLGQEMSAVTNSYVKVFKSATLCQSASFLAAPVASNKIICSGQSASLFALGTGTIGWYSEGIAGNYLGGGQNYITPLLTSSTTYYVQDSTSLGCSSRKAVLVAVNPSPPVAPVALNKSSCTGNTASLSAIGIGTLGWYSEEIAGTYLGGGPNYITPILTTNTTYYVQDSTCAPSTTRTKVLVTVNSLPPAPPFASNITICSGSKAPLSADGMGTLCWYVNETGGNYLTTGANYLTPELTTTTTYYVQDSTCSGISARTAIIVTVNPLPLVTANANLTTVCAGTKVMLTAGGAVSYTWSDGVTNGIEFAPANNSTYTVTGIDSNACSNIATIMIHVNPLPNVTFNLSEFTITSNQNGALYQWVDCNDNSFISGATNKSYTALVSGNYAVIVLMNACIDTSACVNVNITAIAEPLENNNELIVFPNPGNTTLTVQSKIEGTYSIMNDSGQIIQLFELKNTNKCSVNIENLSNGVYFIIGFNNNKMTRQKVVITK